MKTNIHKYAQDIGKLKMVIWTGWKPKARVLVTYH